MIPVSLEMAPRHVRPQVLLQVWLQEWRSCLCWLWLWLVHSCTNITGKWKAGISCSLNKEEARKTRAVQRLYKWFPINTSQQADNNQQARPLFMKTWQVKLLNTTGAQRTKAGKAFILSNLWILVEAFVSGRIFFTFLDNFGGNVEAKMTFLKVRQRSKRKQVMKRCEENFPILRNLAVLHAHCLADIWSWSLTLLIHV